MQKQNNTIMILGRLVQWPGSVTFCGHCEHYATLSEAFVFHVLADDGACLGVC